MEIPFVEKLAARSTSLKHVLDLQERCIELQMSQEMTITTVTQSAEALVVLNAFHEAARSTVLEIEDDESNTNFAAVIWLCFVKFVGKGLASLGVANLAMRNALWASQEHMWSDSVLRLENALAAAAKLKLHMVAPPILDPRGRLNRGLVPRSPPTFSNKHVQIHLFSL